MTRLVSSCLYHYYFIFTKSLFFFSLSCSFQCPGSTVCTLSVRSAGNASSSPQPCFVVYAFCFFGFFWYGILSYYYYSFFGQYKKSYISKNVCTFCNGTGFWCSVLVFFGLLLLLLFFFCSTENQAALKTVYGIYVAVSRNIYSKGHLERQGKQETKL